MATFSPFGQSFQFGNSFGGSTTTPRIRQLTRHNHKYSQLEYLLRVAIGSLSTSILRIFSLRTEEEISSFNFTNSNNNIIEGWVQNRFLTGVNAIDKVSEAGFTIGANGLPIVTGELDIGPSDIDSESPIPAATLLLEDLQQGNLRNVMPHQAALFTGHIGSPAVQRAQEKSLYKIVFCLVATGKSFCIEAVEGAHLMPQGFDSLYLQPSADSQYNHTYLMFDNTKILPLYLIFFEHDGHGDLPMKSPQPVQQTASATGATIQPPVPTSPTQAAPLSSSETIVKAAYAQAIAAIEKNTTEETERSNQSIAAIDRSIANIELKRAEVVANAAAAEAALKKQFRDAMIALHDTTQLKLSALLSSEADLRRRSEELAWLDNFMHYQKDIVSPIAFLDSFAQHSIMKKEKLDRIPLKIHEAEQSAMAVLPDVEVKGYLRIVSASTKPNSQMRQVEISPDVLKKKPSGQM